MKYLTFSTKVIIILAVFGILNTIYQIPHTVFAEGISLKTQPSNLQIRATSPSDVRAPFTLTNVSENPITLSILIKRFRDAGDSTGKLMYSNPTMLTDANTDIFLKNIQIVDDTVAITQLTMGPKQKKNLVLRVNIPKDASMNSEQDHYFSVVFLSKGAIDEANTEVEEDTTTSQIQAGISIPVLLSLNHIEGRTTFLDEFSGPLVIESGPVPFTVVVKNTGEHFVEAHGIILIKNMFGQTVGKIELPKTNILAGSKRAITAGSPHSQTPNNTQSFWSEKFLLGFYTATISLTTSPDKLLYTKSIRFVAFPAVGFGIVFILFLIGLFLIRRVKKKLSQG